MPTKYYIISLIITISIFYIISCSDITGPYEVSVNINKVKNIEWDVVAVETPAYSLNLKNYKPFRLVLRDNGLIAFDSGNWMTADSYTIINDTLKISGGGEISVGRPPGNYISYNH